MSRMDAQFAEVKSMIFDIQKSQDFICKEFDKIIIETKKIALDNLALSKQYEALKQSYLKQDERINTMEALLDIPLQKEISRNIVICGVPADVQDSSDFIAETIISVNGEAIITEIKKMYQYPKSSLKNSFIVTLNSVEMKNDVLAKLKKHHRKSSPSANPAGCYFMHHFTKFQSRLYNEAKKLQSAQRYKYLWIKDGKIFLRKSADSVVHHIFCMTDIFRLDKCPTPQQAHDSEIVDTSDDLLS